MPNLVSAALPLPRRSAPPSELAWVHFIVHWVVGMVILAIIITTTVLTDASPKTSPQGFVIFGGYALGIPAGVAGLLRVPLMWWWFRRAGGWPAARPGRLWWLLGGTVLVFVGSITAPVLAYKLYKGQALLHAATYGSATMWFYYGASLPWLAGAVATAWWQRQRLWPVADGPAAPAFIIAPTAPNRAQPAAPEPPAAFPPAA